MKKGLIWESIVISLVFYIFVIALVLVFFYFFKVHISLKLREEYQWNKVQEVPLDLLSMDIDGESFISKMNKVYYGFENERDFREKINDTISKQVFNEYTPLEANIKINEKTITLIEEPQLGSRIEYSAIYPIPLTFNGTTKFLGNMSYKVSEGGEE